MIGNGSIILRRTGKADGFYISCENNEILCSQIKNGRLAEESEVLHSGSNAEFDAVIDKNDNVHMVLGDNLGNIFYFRNVSGRWARAYLMKSDGNNTAKMGRCFMFMHESVLSVICAVKKEDTVAICHLLIGDEIGKPVIVGEFSGESDAFFSVRSEDKDISVFYTEKSSGSFGRKKLLWGEKRWGDFEELEKDGRNVSSVFAVSVKDRLDVCFKRNDELCFLRIGSFFDGDRVVSRSSLTKRHTRDAALPVLVYSGRLLRIMWIDRRRIFMSETDEENIRWCRLKEEILRENVKIDIYKLCDAYSDETVYNLGFTDKAALFFYDGEELFLREREKTGRKMKREGEDAEMLAGIAKNREYRREDIEKEKKRIMEMMGIKESNDDFSEDFSRDIEDKQDKKAEIEREKAENADKTQKTGASEREKNGEEILINEIKRLNEILGGLQNDVEKLKSFIRIYVGRENGKKISVKVHKK